MSAIRWVLDLVGGRGGSSGKSHEGASAEKWGEGVQHFMDGKEHFDGGRDEVALACLDRAIDCGFVHHEAFEMRAMCLQKAGYDLDAIDDFDKVIAAQPRDCNLRFMRALSLSAVCRYAEAANDLREAIRLSKIDTLENAACHAYAREIGHPSATAFYEMRLLMNQVDLEMSDEVKQALLARRKFKRRERK